MLRDELFANFLTGRDTTACVLSNLSFVLVPRLDLCLKGSESLDGTLPTLEPVNSMANTQNGLSKCMVTNFLTYLHFIFLMSLLSFHSSSTGSTCPMQLACCV